MHMIDKYNLCTAYKSTVQTEQAGAQYPWSRVANATVDR